MITTVKSSGCELLLELKNDALQPLFTLAQYKSMHGKQEASVYGKVSHKKISMESVKTAICTHVFMHLCVCVCVCEYLQ